MKTDIYEADAFNGSRGEFITSLDTDYRFEKGDEVWIDADGKKLKIRVTWLRLNIADGVVTRELLGLRL
jgi:hypothetical protein